MGTKAAGGVIAALLAQAATASVANAQPAVPCSTSRLVSAITAANAGRATLRLAPSCRYVLTGGLPAIRGDITLAGGPSTTITRSATAPPFRLIEVERDGVLRVRNIFLSGGDAGAGTGGAIRNSGGTVELTRTTVSGNRAALGGGLDNVAPGRMDVDASLVENNTATTVNGGGIFNDGSLSVGSSRVTGNRAAKGQGGGLRNAAPGRAAVSQSTFDRNVAATDGGGIANTGRLTLTHTRIAGNRAGHGGGVATAPGAAPAQTGNVLRDNVPDDCAGCT